MAVAYDASAESHSSTTPSTSESSFSWTHTPSGTPKGVLIFVWTNANANYISSVTYGGITLNRCAETMDTTGEPMRSTAFFLGESIPTGAQSVVVNRTNNATAMYAVSITVTASTDTTIGGTTFINGDGTVSEDSVDDGSPGTNSVRFAGGGFGHSTLPTAGANSTLLQSIDIGNQGYVVVRETTAGQGSRSIGMSSGTSDDRAIVHLAVSETATPASNMKTFIHSRNGVYNGATRYGSISGYSSTSGVTVSDRRAVIPTGGTIGNLKVHMNASPGTGSGWIVAILINGVQRGFVNIDGSSTTGSDKNFYTVSAGDVVSIVMQVYDSPSGSRLYTQCEFISSTSGESILLGGNQDSNKTSTSLSRTMFPSGTTALNSSFNGKGILPTSGTIKKLYVDLDSDPGNSPEGYSVTLYKNGSSTSITTTITADSKSGNDTSNTQTFSPGDNASLLVQPVNSPTVSVWVAFGMVFVPDIDGESIVMGGSDNNLDSSATEYISTVGDGPNLSSTEEDHASFIDGIFLRRFYSELSGTPGSGKSYTFTLQKDSYDTDLSTTVSDTNTTDNNIIDRAYFTNSVVSIKTVPSGTPTARAYFFGLVMEESGPRVGLETPSDSSSGSDTTPTLQFVGNDLESDDIRYNVQIDTINTFDSQLEVGDVSLDGSVISSNDTDTASITVSDNKNRLLIVSFASYQGGLPSGVTYGGVSLTKIVEQEGSYGENASIWGLVAPAVGTYDVTVSGAGSWYGFGVYSLYGCKQSIPTNFSKTNGDSSTASLDITTVYDKSLVITCIESESVATMTTSGGTEDWNEEGASYQHGEGHRVTKTTAGSQTMSASLSYGSRWNQCNVEIPSAVPLFDGVSGTDAGFSGSPDSSDPFASGQSVTFTVQAGDELPEDTYYWRVRGIDPSGDNFYGPWSNIWSFTVSSASSGIKSISGVTQVNIKSIEGVTNINIKSIAGVANS